MTETSLAIEAHQKSIAYAMTGEKEKWLELFDADAIVHDPVGPSMHDPGGKGARGHAELSAFWNLMIGPSNLLFVPHKRIRSGVHAVTMTASMCCKALRPLLKWSRCTVLMRRAS
jgi:steroid delta-isomerase